MSAIAAAYIVLGEHLRWGPVVTGALGGLALAARLGRAAPRRRLGEGAAGVVVGGRGDRAPSTESWVQIDSTPVATR